MKKEPIGLHVLWNIDELELVGLLGGVVRLGEAPGHVVGAGLLTVGQSRREASRVGGGETRGHRRRRGRAAKVPAPRSRARRRRGSLRAVAGGRCVQPARRSESL